MTELEELQRKYESGQLDPVREDLERFLCAHRADIARYRAEQVPGIPEDDVVRRFILLHRTFNPQREIREQLEEIQREKWIRGVQTGCPPDPNQVAREWSRQHSAAWRAHRVTAVMYVFEREKERFLKLLA